LRVLPRSIAIGAPVAALLGFLVGSAMALKPTEFLAFLAYLALNVAFAVSLTFAYVVSSSMIVILGWSVFAVALAVAPTVWWLPSGAATVVCAAAVSAVAHVHGRDNSALPPVRASAAAGARGLATALPLWGLPLMVFIDDPRGTSMAALFLAILPAVLLYQIYFSFVARPLWSEIDMFRRGLERVGPASLGALAAPIRRSIWRGETVLFSGIAVGGTVMFVVTTSGMTAEPLVMPLFAASVAGTVFIAEATRLSMVSSDRALVWGGLTLAGTYLAAWQLLGVNSALWLLAGVGVMAAAGVALRNAQCWRQLEYRLFWRSAASA
jgi:hypothetical protein